MNLPRHVVIVPDGNRRWAKKKGKNSFFGHRAGMKAMEKIAETALKLEIPCLTVWGCSVANITQRSPAEVKFLYALFEAMFKKLAKRKELKSKDIRVRVLGRWQEFFPESLKKAIRRIIQATQEHRRHNLTLLMAYDGRDEMLAAIRKISALGKEPSLIDRETLKSNLWSAELPPVDLVIRTGGEPHWSAGMMMWDVAEAQLYFTETLWPDFSPKEFQKALDYYAGTERRYGK
jgi:undecaprenyl diphosphate synthase